MFVILTSKPGIFRTDAPDDLKAVESYDYMFYGERKARFVIAELAAETRVRIVEETESGTTNVVRTKFLEHFDTIEEARAELAHLTSFGSMKTSLVRL